MLVLVDLHRVREQGGRWRVIQVSAGATIYVAEQPNRFTTRLKGTLAVCRDLLAIKPMVSA
jgi:hypothetical protein